MKTILLYSILFVTAVQAQVNNLSEKYTMDNSVEETSGLIFHNNKLITHNDSGGTAQLFEMDTISNAITRTVTLTNATNVDWEDISQDADYIYIGDFGNNNGTRTDLKVYRIPKSEYDANTSISAEVINFSYSDQVDFTSNSDTNFDAEAMVVKDNNILIFTKNHGDLKSNIYSFSKTPGTYSATKIGTYNVNGLITGADINETSQELYLTGYSDTLVPFIIQVADMTNPVVTKVAILSQGSQVEAIASIGNRYFISREHFVYNTYDFPQKLYAFNGNNTASISTNNELVANMYPNPSKGVFNIALKNNTSGSFVIYNQLGQAVKQANFDNTNNIEVELDKKGVYILRLSTTEGTQTQQLIVN